MQKEADEWWENEATPQIIALKRRRKEVQQELNDIITNDVILSDLSQSMQNDNDIFKLLRIVERGRANTLQSAISVYYDDYERQERYEEARAQRQQLIEENQKLRSEIQNTEKTLQQINDLQEYEYWRGQSR